MTTDLQLFVFGTEDVRVLEQDGEPWFVAADIARVLGYSTTAAMTRSMDDDERGVQILHTPSGAQSMTVISEPGRARSHAHPHTGATVLDAPQVRVTAKGLDDLRRHLGSTSPLLQLEEVDA